jgi:uncharacterized protein (TIGR03437 family)
MSLQGIHANQPENLVKSYLPNPCKPNRLRLFPLCLLALCLTSAQGQQYTISTVAGNGTQGFSGDSGPATAAQLNFPSGIALDSSKNLYIADSVNNRIRMISNGNITTIAGTGTAGFAGDGKAATAATLTSPAGVAVDSAGNVYIADTANSVIRKISGGNISTIAGVNLAGYSGDTGDPTKAQLNLPTGVAVDSSGNIFIADSGNNAIRKISGAIITTVVGNNITTLQLNHPDTVAVDAAGNLYITDTVNRRIVKYSGGDKTTVLAGNGIPSFSGDNGPAAKATLNDPVGLAVDAAGNVYIADTFNNRIRKILPDGTITTIAGNGLTGYAGDGGPATKAELFFPRSVLVDSTGNLYVGDSVNAVIRQLQVAAPTIGSGGIVNAASFSPQISPGALATVFGSNFAAGNTSSASPLSTKLAGVSVTVNGVAAPILFVSPGQINFQVPWETAVGNANVQVNAGGVLSNTLVGKVLQAGPGLFSYGANRAVVQNADFSLNTPTNPVKAGGTIIAYLTGSGPVSPPVANGQPTPSTGFTRATLPATATIGSSAATVSFAGLTPGFVGLLQMNIIVPSTLASGDYPLAVAINGETSNSAIISVAK